MVELERHDGGVEPRVDGVEHAGSHRHAVVAFEHRRSVGEQGRHGIAALDPAFRQRGRKAPRARVELGVAATQCTMDDGGVVGKHRGRSLQERERRERLKIRRVAVEIYVVRRVRHGAIMRWVARIISTGVWGVKSVLGRMAAPAPPTRLANATARRTMAVTWDGLGRLTPPRTVVRRCEGVAPWMPARAAITRSMRAGNATRRVSGAKRRGTSTGSRRPSRCSILKPASTDAGSPAASATPVGTPSTVMS